MVDVDIEPFRSGPARCVRLWTTSRLRTTSRSLQSMSWLAVSRSGRWAAILHRAGVVLLRNSRALSGIAVDGPRRLIRRRDPVEANEPELGDDVCWSTARRAPHDAAGISHQHACVAGVVQDVPACQSYHLGSMSEVVQAYRARPVVAVKVGRRRSSLRCG